VNAIYAGSLTVSNDSYDVVSFPSLSTLEKAISPVAHCRVVRIQCVSRPAEIERI
jgi:hypothetical protein